MKSAPKHNQVGQLAPIDEPPESRYFSDHMQIHLAQASELPEIAALVNSVYRGNSSRAGWTTEADFFEGARTSAESLAQDLAAGPGRMFLTFRETADGPLVGCVYLQTGYGPSAEACYLGMLSVNAAAQAKGLGRFIMGAAEEKAREHNASHMVLRVLSPRTELMAWYERRGYRRTGEVSPFPYEKAAAERPTRMDMQFIHFRKDL
ncbi:MAG: GNAT family N-acetyltransferase [Bdellovibrionota bacterium]